MYRYFSLHSSMPSSQLSFNSRGSYFCLSHDTDQRNCCLSPASPSCLLPRLSTLINTLTQRCLLILQVLSPLVQLVVSSLAYPYQFLWLELVEWSPDRKNKPYLPGPGFCSCLSSQIPKRKRLMRSKCWANKTWLNTTSCLFSAPHLIQKYHFLDSQHWKNEIICLKRRDSFFFAFSPCKYLNDTVLTFLCCFPLACRLSHTLATSLPSWGQFSLTSRIVILKP